MKKKPILKDSPPSSRIVRYTVGDGLTKRDMASVTGLQNPSPEAIAELMAFFQGIGKVSIFNGRVLFAEKWAQSFIDRDGPFKSIAESTAERNETPRWYAAEILSDIKFLRKIMERVQTDPKAARKETDALAKFAFELGLMVYEPLGFKFPNEADTLRGIAGMEGARSKKPPRKSIPLRTSCQWRSLP